ncbi:hypothetical protein [Macrococcoides goetzii]|uniref:hypothetical protein n=1 Tax=Macrococcoides goetzii TaxID=1891097 RepID=UPI000C1574A2|nr:hypothetical protein [Macrococcus goetzii]
MINKIMIVLDCSETYAKKLIELCNGEYGEIRKIVAIKIEEKNKFRNTKYQNY